MKPLQTRQLWLASATAQLTQAGIPSAGLDARLLIERVLKLTTEQLLVRLEEALAEDQLQTLNTLIAQRLERLPIAYILKNKAFYGHNFYVDQRVLIPRPESEAMLDFMLFSAKKQPFNTLIDVGTGSGCLAISAKLALPDVHVNASDLSEEALAVARQNAKRHGVNIRFFKSDLLSRLPNMSRTKAYLILANLPYVPIGLITSAEIATEPSSALFSGHDGLGHYQRLFQQLDQLNNQPQQVITECLPQQRAQLAQLANGIGYQLSDQTNNVQLFSQV